MKGEKTHLTLKKKYKPSDVGNVRDIAMLKEKISAGATKIRRYEEKELLYTRKVSLEQTKHSFIRKLMFVVTFQMDS